MMQYEGETQDGKPHGKGIKRWPNGNWYKGDFVAGKSHGKGAHFWANESKKVEAIRPGDLFEGEFVENNIHGNGLRYTKDGKVFKDEWVVSDLISSTEDAGAKQPEHYLEALKESEERAANMASGGGTEQAKMQALLGGAKAQATKLLSKLEQQTIDLTAEDMNASSTLVVQGCKSCTVTLKTPCTKVMIQDCSDCTFVFEATVITQTVELFKSDNSTCRISTPIKTFQLDVCDGVEATFMSSDHFQNMVWAACERVHLTITPSEELQTVSKITTPFDLVTGFTEMKAEYQNLSDEERTTEQFIVRIIKKKLLQERVIRLDNGFPSTEREARDYQERQQQSLRAMAKEAGLLVPRDNQADAHVGRNQPCSCGSGKKFKKCCGRNA